MVRSVSTRPLPTSLRRHDLGQPALAEPAHQFHLPEAVLGMDVAQAEGGILDRARDDVRHRVLVAQDLDRRLQAGRVERAGCRTAARRGPGSRCRRRKISDAPAPCRPEALPGRRRGGRAARTGSSRRGRRGWRARSPSRSGAARRVVGSAKADILSGLPASFSVPPLPSGTSTSMLRAATCGWAMACSMLLIGPQGTPALETTSIQ